MTLSNELLLKIYTNMVRQRALDYQLIKGAKSGKMYSGWHSGLGEDAITAAVTLLRKDDYVTYTHRGAYVWIAKGMNMKDILAEFYGKATGCAGGYGGTHIAKPSLGIYGRCGMQGGHFPIAVGMGITAQLNARGQVAMMFFGDGCGTRGLLHEAFNHSSVWKLPIIWINENNGLSQSVKLGKTWATDRISKIAGNYNMPGKTVDGNDAIAVAEAAEELIERARQGKGPALLEMVTYRWRGHFEGEAMKYRTREEIKEWQAKDPVVRLEKQLLERGVINQEFINKIKADADLEVAEAQKFADESPEPNPKDMLSKVYASSHT